MIKNGKRVYEVIKHILCDLLRSIIQQRLIKCINKNITQTKQLLSPMYVAINTICKTKYYDGRSG